MLTRSSQLEDKLLNHRWQLVSSKIPENGYKMLRMSSVCKAEFFVAINKKNERCLILFAPNLHSIKLADIEREKITVNFNNNANFMIITLKDIDYCDVFDDLAISLHSTIKDLSSELDYLPKFIKQLQQWIQFFVLPANDRLDKNQVLGLWGELSILIEFIKKNTDLEINDVVAAWTGPFDHTHDFEFEDIDFEVKTKKSNQHSVHISSEFQLDVEDGKKLNLLVLTVQEDVQKGHSLQMQYKILKDLIAERLGNLELLLIRLHLYGLTPANISEYDNLRFIPERKVVYDCLHSDFPKLTNQNIPNALSNLTYRINLTTLNEFELEAEIYDGN